MGKINYKVFSIGILAFSVIMLFGAFPSVSAGSSEIDPCDEPGTPGEAPVGNFILGLLVPEQFRAFAGTTFIYGPCADLEVEKYYTDGDETEPSCCPDSFFIKVTNNGPHGAENVGIKDIQNRGGNEDNDVAHDHGWSAVRGIWNFITSQCSNNCQEITWEFNIPYITQGESALLRIPYHVTNTGIFSNSAEVISSDQVDPDSTPNNGIIGEDDDSIAVVTSSAPCPDPFNGPFFILGLLVPEQFRAYGGSTFDGNCADLTIEKVYDSGPVTEGEIITYRITVTNNGPDDAEDVVVRDFLDYQQQFVGTQGCIDDFDSFPRCKLGDLEAGESVTFTLSTTAENHYGDFAFSVYNSVHVRSSTFDQWTNNNWAYDYVRVRADPCAEPEHDDSNGPQFLLSLLVPEMFRAYGGSTIDEPCIIPSSSSDSLPYPDPNLGDPKHGQGHSDGFCMNQNCMDVTGLFNHFPEAVVPQGSTQTFSLLISCPRGAHTCDHISLAGALPDADFYDDRWTVTVDKQPTTDQWDLTVMNDYGEINADGVTVTVQVIDQTFITATLNVPFLIPGSIGSEDGVDATHANNRHLHVVVHDNHGGASNYIFNEGMYVQDIYAYPQIDMAFDPALEYEPLCLNEDSTKRHTCAFDKVKDWTIKNAEEKLKEMNISTD